MPDKIILPYVDSIYRPIVDVDTHCRRFTSIADSIAAYYTIFDVIVKFSSVVNIKI